MPKDANARAHLIGEMATGQAPPEELPAVEKNPHAVALGRLGGKKGGLARAKKLSARRRRREIAKKAAKVRWGGDEK